MPQAKANGLTLEYETFGRDDAPAILLIMGLGAQLTLWPDSFCNALAKAGYYVIRYDNRDIGLSTKLNELGRPQLMRASLAYKFGRPVQSSYSLEDMAGDAAGLLDALGIRRAHVVGASMGGMIAQILGARFAERVLSLVLVMTSSGNPKVRGPSLKVGLRLVKKPKSFDRETLINHSLGTWKMIASPGYPMPDDERRRQAERHFDRAFNPLGVARQTMAIMASGDRTPMLANITAPTLIIHGRDDVLVPVGAGYDLAERINGSTLEVLPGMGHDLPEQLVPQIAASVLRHVGGAEHDRAQRHRTVPLSAGRLHAAQQNRVA